MSEGVYRRGRIVLGRLAKPLRNGSCILALRWEARLLPARECEGGGWYSAHPTEKRWHVKYKAEHKFTGHQAFPKIADAHDFADLDEAIAAVTQREMKRHGLTPMQNGTPCDA